MTQNAITHIEFVKADHLQNGFGLLGKISFDDPDEAERFWNAIPEIEADPETDDFNFLADQFCGDHNLTDTKYVSADFIGQYISGDLHEHSDRYLALVEDLCAQRLAAGAG